MNMVYAIIKAFPYMSDAWQFFFITLLFFVLAGFATIIYAVCYEVRNALRERARRRRIYYWRY